MTNILAGRRGRLKFYDKQRVLEEIVSGDYSAAEIAKKHDITRDMVYSLKFAAKKKNLIKDPVVKLDDLDPVERRIKGLTLPSKIMELARQFKSGTLDDFEFMRESRKLLT